MSNGRFAPTPEGRILLIPAGGQEMDFGNILAASLSPIQKIRENATNALETAANENFGGYMSTLSNELCDERQDGKVRQAAGVALKNALVSKDAVVRQQYGARWMNVPEMTRERMKGQLLTGLGSPNVKAGTAAAQATAAVAFVELPLGAWPSLMQCLLEGATSADENMRRCSIEAIGFICEEIEPSVLESKSNEILTAVVNGLRPEESSPAVKAVAAKAVLNSVEFIRSNFDRDAERDIIMSVVCNATQVDNDAIRLPAFECLIRIMQLYYPLMRSYMDGGLAALVISSMASDKEPVALQAIEFWSTVSDIERDLQEAEACDFECLDFARAALPSLLPPLLHMLRQQEESSEDEWNTSMAAGTCLALLAECVKNDIFTGNILLSFIQENIGSADWRGREAALMAYGSVMDGPDATHAKLLVDQGLPIVLKIMPDPSVPVRDTAAWVVGRVVDFFFEIVPAALFPEVVGSLVTGVTDAPRVAANCCWSLMSMAVHYGDDNNDLSSSAISAHWSSIATALFGATQRSDADENNLRVAAFQALATLVLFAPMDCVGEVNWLQTMIVAQLSESQRMADMIVNIDDRMRYSDLQANLCTVLANSIKKLGKPSLPLADQAMASIMTIFRNASLGKGSATELEDVFMLIGTLVSELETDFLRFVDPFMPMLYMAIGNHAEYHLCSVAIGVVGDFARALGSTMLPYCDALMSHLFQALQDAQLAREVIPHAISALGDIALAVSGAFVNYLQSTMFMLSQAGEIVVTDANDFDEIDLVCDIRLAILHSYTGIVQGFKDDQQAIMALSVYVPQIIHVIKLVSGDVNCTDEMVRAAIGLVGDLADTYRTQMRSVLRDHDWLLHFVERPLGGAISEATLSIVKWTQSVRSLLCVYLVTNAV